MSEQLEAMPKTKSIEIVAITLLKSKYGCDTLILHTTLPEAIWPYKNAACFRQDAARNNGERYCKEHYPDVPLKIIET